MYNINLTTNPLVSYEIRLKDLVNETFNHLLIFYKVKVLNAIIFNSVYTTV